MAALVYIVVFLALTGYSSAIYCICKDGIGDQALQKALDYACGAGADCTPILQSGACYQPNTVKDHCNWAVNSYYQRKGQAQGSCDFAGAASQSQTAPATQNSNCVFPASASQTGNSTTPTGTPTTTSPSTTPSTTTPSTTPTTTTPTTGNPSTTFGNISPGSSTTFDGNANGGAAISPAIFSAVMTLFWFSVFLLQN